MGFLTALSLKVLTLGFTDGAAASKFLSNHF
jgi:hypothetical protein